MDGRKYRLRGRRQLDEPELAGLLRHEAGGGDEVWAARPVPEELLREL